VHEELGDVAAVRLVRRPGARDLHGPDYPPVEEGGEEEPLAELDLGDDVLERGSRVVVREAGHVADRRAARDAVDEHVGELGQDASGLVGREGLDLHVAHRTSRSRASRASG
jgi:hypothetical protein